MPDTLLDFADYPEVDCHGVGDVRIFRKNFAIYLYRWRRIDGLFRKVVVGSVTRPMEDWELAPMKDFAAMYLQQRPAISH